MYKILSLFVLFFFISCGEIQYDGEKRLVFQTQILDAENLPLKNSFVNINVSNNFSTDEISYGKTDENGRIILLFPSPKNEFNISLKIYNEDSFYLDKEIVSINSTDFIDYKFVLEKINLLKREQAAALNLTYNQTSGNILKNVTIVGIYHIDSEIYNSSDSDYFNIPSQFLIKKNQSFQLKYTTKSSQNGELITKTIDINIGNDPINYSLNY